MKKSLSKIFVLFILLASLPSFFIFNVIEIYNNKIKVSVLIPVYKVEKYLRECMDSVVNQTLKEIEIICVDDGSPDNCGKILDEYARKDKRITVVHQDNQGLPAARMAGISRAKGEYIKFVDSDDILDLKACEICYKKAKLEDADLVVHGAYSFKNECTKENLRHYKTFKNEILYGQNFDLFVINVWTGLYKTSVIKDNDLSFNLEAQMGEDRTFNEIFVPFARKIVTMKDQLYYYRRDNSSSLCSTVKGANRFKDLISNIKYVYDDWNSRGYFSSVKAKISFLNWSLHKFLCPDDADFYELFLDAIDESLLTQEVIDGLSRESKAKLEKIQKVVGVSREAAVAGL